ncbi:3337_t:CDS:1, partial [Funneliformis mosseae]
MDEIEFIPILEKVSPIEAKIFISETMRFLYEQEREFGEVSEELK